MLGRRDSDGRFGAEMKRLVDERNAVLYEYSRVMMERDVVHREIEQLQTDLSLSNAKWRALETENVQLAEENAQLKCKVEALNREITVVLEDHDTLLKVMLHCSIKRKILIESYFNSILFNVFSSF